ncbi:hypothetical protein AC1031_012791 [Aphanomyces cochlioides]|nr:hypothetical protein AC1031_012791 [Aphanomyces cochlioides]
MSDPGECGELATAEAITKDTTTLSTHNYWLNANPSDGHDTWGTSPTNAPGTFVTILDQASGVNKVLQLSRVTVSFDITSSDEPAYPSQSLTSDSCWINLHHVNSRLPDNVAAYGW